MKEFVKLLEKIGIAHELHDGRVVVTGYADFSGCTALTAIGNGVTFGGWADFDGCTALTTIGDNVTFNDWADFSACAALPGAQHNCGNERLTIYAVMCSDGVVRANLGCQRLTRAEAIAAISRKYGNTPAGAEYISKAAAAFDYAEGYWVKP